MNKMKITRKNSQSIINKPKIMNRKLLVLHHRRHLTHLLLQARAVLHQILMKPLMRIQFLRRKESPEENDIRQKFILP